MIIAQISDTHISAEHEDGPRRADDLRNAIRAINALDPVPDLVIHTGDLVNRGKPEEYALACSLLETLRPPLYAVPGNRDDRGLMRQSLNRIGGRLPSGKFLQYAIEEYPVRLIALDSLSGHGNKGALCRDRLTWLRNTLDQDKAKPVALFIHHPPFDIWAAKDPFQFDRREDAQNLEKIVAGSGRVIGLFCGHAHRAARVIFGEAPAASMPSIATSLQKGTSASPMERHPVVCIHNYQPEKGCFQTNHQDCF